MSVLRRYIQKGRTCKQMKNGTVTGASWHTLCSDTQAIILKKLFSCDCVKKDLDLLKIRTVSKQFASHASHILHRSKIFKMVSDMVDASPPPDAFVHNLVTMLIELASVRAPKFPTIVYAKIYYHITNEVHFDYRNFTTSDHSWCSSRQANLTLSHRKRLYRAAMGYEKSACTATNLLHCANLHEEDECRVIETLDKLFRFLPGTLQPSVKTLLSRHLNTLKVDKKN